MLKLREKILLSFILVLMVLLYITSQTILGAKDENIPKKSEKITEFDGGSLYKVKENGKTRDIIVYNNGSIEDFNAGKHANLLKKDKLSKEFKKKINNNTSGPVTVTVWLNNVDKKNIEKKAIEKLNISDIESADRAILQKFIEEKRLQMKGEYAKKKSAIKSKYLKDEEIIFESNYAPMLIIKTDVKNIEKLKNDGDVVFLDTFADLKKSDEMTYSTKNINANYTKNTMGLRGEGVKIGIIEMGYPDKSNAQLSSSNITFDISDTEAKNYITTHATRVSSIIAGNTEGIVPKASVYVARAVNRTQDYQKIEWLISQGVNIINYSSGYADLRGEYSDMAKWIDHLAYDLNITFVKSAGNASGSSYGITDPGMAYNSNVVGSICDKDSANEPNWTDDIFSSFSCYKENSGCYKPDFTAPGEGIDVAGMTGNNGTSFAAPHVTALIAELFGYKSSLATKPAAISAILKAGTTHKTASDYGTYELTPNYSDKEGAGVIDAKGAYTVTLGNKFVQTTLENSQFPYTKTYNVTSAAKPVRVALTWLKQNSLVSGSVVERDLSDLDLMIYDPNGSLIATSESGNNNNELVEFMPTMTGNYQFVVTGYKLMNSNEIIGLSWNQ